MRPSEMHQESVMHQEGPRRIRTWAAAADSAVPPPAQHPPHGASSSKHQEPIFSLLFISMLKMLQMYEGEKNSTAHIHYIGNVVLGTV